jgi:hypothetical protein
MSPATARGRVTTCVQAAAVSSRLRLLGFRRSDAGPERWDDARGVAVIGESSRRPAARSRRRISAETKIETMIQLDAPIAASRPLRRMCVCRGEMVMLAVSRTADHAGLDANRPVMGAPNGWPLRPEAKFIGLCAGHISWRASRECAPVSVEVRVRAGRSSLI